MQHVIINLNFIPNIIKFQIKQKMPKKPTKKIVKDKSNHGKTKYDQYHIQCVRPVKLINKCE